MGTFYHLDGLLLENCAKNRCGDRPVSNPFASDPEFSAKLNKWNTCFQSCKDAKLREGLGASSTSAVTQTSSTSASDTTSGSNPKVLIDQFAATTENGAATTGTSTNMKIGIGLGILAIGFIGYKLLTKSKSKA